VNETHNFWCEKCKKRVTMKAANRSEAQSIMRKSGWSLRIGGYLGMVVGLWTCPECQGKEVRK
jgi:hypothetical protein